MSRVDIPTWLKNSAELAVRIRGRDHRRFPRRASRVPEGCVLLADGSNAVYRTGQLPPVESEGLLVKTWGQQITIDFDDLQSKDEQKVDATLTFSLKIAGEDVRQVKPFSDLFSLLSGEERRGGNLQTVANWLKTQILGSVALFARQRGVGELVEANGPILLRDLDGVLQSILQECRIAKGIRASLVKVLFESPEYKKQEAETRRHRHERREIEFDAECRVELHSIEEKARLRQEITTREVDMAIKLKEHEAWKQGRLLDIERELLLKDLEEKHLVRVQATHARLETEARYAPQDVLDLLNKLKSWPTQPPSSPTVLWALFAACLLVAACALSVLVLSNRDGSAQQIEKLLGVLLNRPTQVVLPLSPAEQVVATVSVFRAVGQKPYDREISGILNISVQAVTFKSTGPNADAAHDFRIPLSQVKDVAWRGEREPVLISTTFGLGFRVALNPSEPHSEVQTSAQLYKLLSGAKDDAASSSPTR